MNFIKKLLKKFFKTKKPKQNFDYKKIIEEKNKQLMKAYRLGPGPF